MITITKDIKITIDKGDVPVLTDICEMARKHMGVVILAGVVISAEYPEERLQEIRKFLRIIFDGVKL